MANQNIKFKSLDGSDVLFPVTPATNVYLGNGSDVNKNLGTVEEGAQVNKIEGVQVNGTDLTIASKKVNIPIAGDNTVTGSNLGVVKVDGLSIKIDNNGVISSAGSDSYTIKKETTAETGFFATYKLYKTPVGGTETAVGASINIPKDFLVKSGKVDTVTTADKDATTTPPGKFSESPKYDDFLVGDKYLDFIVNVKAGTAETDEHIYILVKQLVDVYTAGDGISIDGTNKVSVKLTTNKGLQFESTNKTLEVLVDGTTVDFTSGALEVKDSAITNSKINSALKSTTIAVDGSATDDKLTTEKAVRTELDKKLEGVQINGTDLTISSNKVNIPVASDSVLGVVKVDNATIKLSSGNALEAQVMTAATATAGGSKGIVPASTNGDNNSFLSGAATWIKGVTYEVI